MKTILFFYCLQITSLFNNQIKIFFTYGLSKHEIMSFDYKIVSVFIHFYWKSMNIYLITLFTEYFDCHIFSFICILHYLISLCLVHVYDSVFSAFLKSRIDVDSIHVKRSGDITLNQQTLSSCMNVFTNAMFKSCCCIFHLN
jgi:hypothetical protein